MAATMRPFAVASSRPSRVAARRATTATPTATTTTTRGASCARTRTSTHPTTIQRRRALDRRGRRARAPVAALAPNELNEIASGTLLTLSGAETLLGKVSFGSLLTATSIYWSKARHHAVTLGIRQSRRPRSEPMAASALPVSYTHLTLPTKA